MSMLINVYVNPLLAIVSAIHCPVVLIVTIESWQSLPVEGACLYFYLHGYFACSNRESVTALTKTANRQLKRSSLLLALCERNIDSISNVLCTLPMWPTTMLFFARVFDGFNASLLASFLLSLRHFSTSEWVRSYVWHNSASARAALQAAASFVKPSQGNGVDADFECTVLGWCAIREGSSPVLAPNTTRLSPELDLPYVLSSGQQL